MCRNRYMRVSASASPCWGLAWVSLEVEFAGSHPVRAACNVYDGAGLITSNLTSCLMNTGTSFSGNEFSLENCGSRIQVYLNEVTWGR